MIGWGDLYKVVEAIVPLYVILFAGYGAFRYVYGPLGNEAHDTFSKLLYYFVLPSFTFELTSHIDPFHLNIPFLLADFISKFLILVCLVLWATRSPNGSYDWSITCFSLSSLTNSLIVGVPFIQVMYGQMGVDLVVQGSAFQAIVWLTGLLFILEHRRTRLAFSVAAQNGGMDTEAPSTSTSSNRSSFIQALMKSVLPKLAKNPNSYACIIGLSWAFLAKRRHIQMPRIVENSVGIMSNMGIGSAMFNMGIFMGLQEKWIACGARQVLIGMVLKFIAGPIAMVIGSFVMRLHGDVLRVAILQAAIPLSITSFIYAKEYKLHEKVLSTAVIFGAIFSLPVLVAYYSILEFA